MSKMQTKKLGELCCIEIGKTPYRGNKSLWDHEKVTKNIWLSIADLLNSSNNTVYDSKEYISERGAALCKKVKKDTLLVSFKLTLGRLVFSGIDLYTNEAIAALNIIDEEVIDKHYLFYYLTFFDWNKAAEGSHKVKGKSLNKAKLREINITFPESLEEQKRIVKILSKFFINLEKTKENTKKNMQNAKELFESCLENIFAYPKDDWKEKTLKQISLEFGRGKSKHRPRNDKKLYDGDYPFIQTGDIRNCDHLITTFSQTYNNIGLEQSKLWPKGTICITIAANIAETGILDFDACFPDSVIGIVVDPKVAEISFVEYLLQSFKVRIQAKGKGSAQMNINMATFEYEVFPFPTLSEQKSIIAKLDSLSTETKKLEGIYTKKLVNLEVLKKSILQKAFNGELTAKEIDKELQAEVQ